MWIVYADPFLGECGIRVAFSNTWPYNTAQNETEV